MSSCHAWSARGRPLGLLRLAASVGALLAATVAANAQSPGDAARTLLRNYQDDPARIDRARDLLEAALARAGTADTATLVTLSRAWFLFAENRTRTEDARLAAYERGRAAAQRAITLDSDLRRDTRNELFAAHPQTPLLPNARASFTSY